MFEILHTVVETEPFLKRATSLWDEKERQEFIDFIAVNPLAGAEIPGTGGLRKIRWSRAGMGKRGGARVIYYYYNETAPVFLLAAYAKSEKEDLSPQEKALFSKVAEAIKSQIRERRKAKRQ
ncbi:MAG: type II toxin-antitoxin system RelE/ParE family toxin [Alphaproteobacteria bacterium]|nr:type II toxin-antitoxin system RelE/ParE family toxin [Alphaproteobacteria bacterium]